MGAWNRIPPVPFAAGAENRGQGSGGATIIIIIAVAVAVTMVGGRNPKARGISRRHRCRGGGPPCYRILVVSRRRSRAALGECATE